MEKHSLSNLRLKGEQADCLWLHFNVPTDIQQLCEQALQPNRLDWSNPCGDGHIAISYETTEFTSDESPIIGGLLDLPVLSDEFQDFLTDLTELAHEALDSQELQLEWMLGFPKTESTHHNLKLTMSYYANRSLCLTVNNKTDRAYFFFEDFSDNTPYYTGNYSEFESLELALKYFNTIYEEVDCDDFSVVSRIFYDIEVSNEI